MPPPDREDAVEENRRLRRTMRDLVALSTLPAVWMGLPIHGIAGGLADVLVSTLSLDLVYIWMAAPSGKSMEVIRPAALGRAPAVDELRALLKHVLASDGTSPPLPLLDFR